MFSKALKLWSVRLRGESDRSCPELYLSLSSPKLFCSKCWRLYLYFKLSHPIVCFLYEMSPWHFEKSLHSGCIYEVVRNWCPYSLLLDGNGGHRLSASILSNFTDQRTFLWERDSGLVKTENQNSTVRILLLGSRFVLKLMPTTIFALS